MRKSVLLLLKGIAMGAADVVPGVSGGTIAFITGIYEEFLNSLRSFNGTAVRKLFKEGIGAFWKHINGQFLLPLFVGIGASIASLAKLITYLLDTHPVLLWAFFFGLILASIWMVGKTVRKWNAGPVVALCIGTAVSFYITTITTIADETTNLGYIFLCGMVAICAMILPGISGSFILLLLGAYELIIGTIKNTIDALIHVEFGKLGDYLKIAGTFAVGAIIGLVSFSHALSWLFKRYHDLTIALLTGFLIGSLNKIWPWKSTLSTYTKHAGEPDQEIIPLIQENVLPWNYGTLNTVELNELGVAAREPMLAAAIGLCVLGIAVIVLLDRFGPTEEPAEA